MKVCSKCGVNKILSDFYKRTVKGKEIIVARCKNCSKKVLSKEDKEKMYERNKRYRARVRLKYGKLLGVFEGMRARCYHKSCPAYRYYGARGIKICPEWKKKSKIFFEWALANGYQDGLQIDRIDNDGNYSPENSRWVTPTENLRNTRRVKLSLNKAKAIRHLFNGGFERNEIAFFFNTTYDQVRSVTDNRTWLEAQEEIN
jgi:hypothetical protein